MATARPLPVTRERMQDAPAPRGSSSAGIIAFGASIAVLSFVDRAAISQAAPWIAKDLHLTPMQMGLVFSAFGLTYSAFEIPSGWLCDRFGVRYLLTRVVLLWSAFTSATGLAWSFASLLAARLMFGAGESGCFPALARMFRGSLSAKERNAAEGIKAAAARWGAAATPLLMASLFVFLNWRQVFGLFGVVGVMWAGAFWWWSRSEPALMQTAPHPRVSSKTLLASRTAWLLGLQWFCHYYGFYFYITWLPTYLYQARGIDLRKGAWASAVPLVAAGLGSLFGGWALSRLVDRFGSRSKARRLLGYTAYGGAATLLLLFTRISDPMLAIAALSLSSFAAELSGPISWTTAMDVGGEHVGTVSGFMNMLGHLGGSVAPAVTGWLLSSSGNAWTFAFVISSANYAVGALCWALIDPVTPLQLETVTREGGRK